MQPLSVPYTFLTVFDNETYRSLSSFQVSKAVGPASTIPKRLFRNFVPELALIMRDIYKQSLREGYIPFLLKSSIVSPLPKVIPPRAIESDLRPISLTCTFVKVMEGFTCMQKTYTPTGWQNRPSPIRSQGEFDNRCPFIQAASCLWSGG